MDVLLNWLGQGVAVALVTAAVLQIVPRSRTRARYAIAWTACVAVVVIPALPLLLSVLAAAPAFVGGVTPAMALPRAAEPVPAVAIPSAWWTNATAALAMWSVWALVSSCRTGAAVFAVRRARRDARSLPPDVERQLVHWQRMRLTGRRARLALSEDVPTAGVLGGRVPIVAISPVLLDRLDLRDLDRVIAHEWAHVQRRDDVAQLLVRIVRAVAGWHPAVWWLERQLHMECEVACDEMAIAATGSAKTYATCLTTLAAMPTERAAVPVLAAVSSSGLRERVIRIIAVRQADAPRARRLTAFAGATAVTMATLVVSQVPIVGASAPAVAHDTIGEDRVLTETPAPPATIVGEGSRVRRPDAVRRTVPASTQHEPQEVRRSPAAAIDMAPSLLAAAPVVSAAAFALPARIAGTTAAPASAVATDGAIEIAPPPQGPAWGKAVDAGKAVGARSEQAAVAAAGFFTRVGKQVARSF